jgi:hypothetical protein
VRVTTIGVLGGPRRATVAPDGTIEPWDGGPAMRWHVAADDRWHTPATSSTVRQRRIDGVAVVETRVRIPDGDAVQRVYDVADHGGMTVVEFENDSPLPIAVAIDGPPVSSARPPTPVPIEGIDLPPGTQVFPVGHRATLTVALPHDRAAVTPLPPVPGPDQVARGWVAVCERAGRLVLPDAALVESVLHQRCELLLNGPGDVFDDPVSFLIAVGELSRLGTDATEWVPEVAAGVHAIARGAVTWDVEAALDAAERVLRGAGERRALRDLARMRRAAVPPEVDRPATAPDGSRLVASVERMLVHRGAIVPGGVPRSWIGQNFEVHDLPAGPATTVSFALRWHGERPAVLWETHGDPVRLTSPVSAPGWSSDAPSGDALWPAGAARV